jgi:hypothetical protein
MFKFPSIRRNYSFVRMRPEYEENSARFYLETYLPNFPGQCSFTGTFNFSGKLPIKNTTKVFASNVKNSDGNDIPIKHIYQQAEGPGFFFI